MPRPARRTGTSSGGLRDPEPVWSAPTGVWIGYASTASDRAASYTSIVVSSCSAARNDAGVGAVVAHRGEAGLGQRVIDDEYVHGVQPTGQAKIAWSRRA